MEPAAQKSASKAQTSQVYSTRMMFFALELIPYFGIPAALGLYIDKQIKAVRPDFGLLPTVLIFMTTYVLSWIIVLWRYRTIRRQFQNK